MHAVINFDLRHGSRLREFAKLRPTRFVAILFAALLATQALGFLVLGVGRWGLGLSESIIVTDGLVALVCVRTAFRRAQGVTALFWFLFGVVLVVLMVPTALQAYDTLFDQALVSDSTRGLLYTLYGAPILMMLFLPEAYGRARLKYEIFLDLFQVAIVVGLIYSTFFFLPLRRMMPDDATLRSISISDAQSLFLLIAAFVRMQFARKRDLWLRVALFLLVCAVATYIGDWLYLHDLTLASWFDLGWAIPFVAAAFMALNWAPSPEPQSTAKSADFLSFLGSNLVLVALLSSISLLMNRWKQAHGGTVTSLAIAASLIAFSFRLALTQYGQQREIVRRKAAQEQFLAANETIGGLLTEARIEASCATQINQLGASLLTSASRDEVFLILPKRLAKLFPETSGYLSVLNVARTRAELVAEWGLLPTADQDATARPGRPLSDAGSISIPLVANNEALGVLMLHDYSSELARHRQLASVVAERIALTISNLDLREALQVQAIRDPLTGLYNRRYMEEFLDREFHRAQRRERSLSLMIIDIDHFKRYNDTFGHPAGDEVLRLVGEALISSVRAEDLACRYGGEEFIIILTECPLPQAALRAEAVRTRLKELYLERAGELPDAVTVSIGLAAFPETTHKVDLLLKLADQALYQGKRAGRDQVVVAHPQTGSAMPAPRLAQSR